MKKRVVAILMAAAMCGTMLAGCGSSGEENGSSTTSNGSADSTSGTSASSGGEETGADGDLLVYGIYKSGDQTWFLDEGDAAKAAV